VNIDLLQSKEGQMAIVGDRSFDSPVAGVMFDMQTGLMSLEFADDEPLDMNIPVEHDFGAHFDLMLDIYVGSIENGAITDARRVPVMLMNDPFGGGNTGRFAVKPGRALGAFEAFLKKCVAGQPLHRDDLGDEGSAGGVMGGINPAVLQFSPQLARQRAIEAAHRAAPVAAPSAPGFGPKGMGGGGNSTVRRTPPPQQRPPVDEDDDY
jgi:hypothetical protein